MDMRLPESFTDHRSETPSPYDLIEFQIRRKQSLIENTFDMVFRGSRNVSRGYVLGGSVQSKQLPYKTIDDLLGLQALGQIMRWNETAMCAWQNLVNYIVGTGHEYQVVRRQGRTSKRDVQMMQNLIEDTMQANQWLCLQEETVDRYINTGDVFRKMVYEDGIPIIKFIESHEIRRGDNSDDFDEFGLRYRENDASVVTAWNRRFYDDRFQLDELVGDEILTPTDMQHIKQGVHKNDPRGVPMFWKAYCHSERINLICEYMADFALKRAAYAVVKEYDIKTDTQSIRRIANSEVKEVEDNDGIPESGKTEHAKGYTVKMPGANLESSSFIEIIQQMQRMIGGMACIPEFMITGDADNGNRHTLISAEGPFDRKVKREQARMSVFDVDLFWNALRVSEGMSRTEMRLMRDRYQIVPKFPEVVPENQSMLSERVINEFDSGMESRKGAISRLGQDPERVLREIVDEGGTLPVAGSRTNSPGGSPGAPDSGSPTRIPGGSAGSTPGGAG